VTSPAAPLLEFLLKPLAPWLDSCETEDIAIQRPGEAWVRQRGAWVREDVPLDLAALEEIAILAASLRKQEVGHLSPLCATELPNGERLQICIPPTVPTGSLSLTVRKPSADLPPLSEVRHRYRSEDWQRWRRFRAGRDMIELLAIFDSGDLEAFLQAAVHARLNILMTGATGSGKTTLAKLAMTAIDHSERIIVIEDSLELVLRQPNNVRLLYSKGDLSGVAINAESLLEASLRMRPDRILLQELREEQAAWVYAHQVVSGHPGSITTIHGHDAPAAFTRLFALCKGSEQGRGFDGKTIIDLLSSAVDLIIPLESRDGVFSIGTAWFVADAARRGESAADLLRAA
jgi:type IV secretion system protein VirB11